MKRVLNGKTIALSACAAVFIGLVVLLIISLGRTSELEAQNLALSEQNDRLTEALRISEENIQVSRDFEAQNKRLQEQNDQLSKDLRLLEIKFEDTEKSLEHLRENLDTYYYSINIWEYGFDDALVTHSDPALTRMLLRHYTALYNGDFEAYRDTMDPRLTEEEYKGAYNYDKGRMQDYSGWEFRVMYSLADSKESYMEPGDFCFTVSVLFREPGTQYPVHMHTSALGLRKYNGKWVVYYDYSGTHFPGKP